MPLLFQENLRYPDKNDKFFIDHGKPAEISWLNKAFQQFGYYADAYQTGAINLINKAIEEDIFRDFHIYPAVFLIRQYLELRLKELIQGLNYLYTGTFEFPQGHNIVQLWDHFITLKRKVDFLDISEVHFDVLRNLIDEMSSVDPRSFSFRYPVDKQGNKTQRLEYVNLTNLKEVFIRTCFAFDGYSDAIERSIGFTTDQLNDLYSGY